MNLTRQSLLRYQGLNGYDGLCHIRVFEQPRKTPVVIAGNLDDNPGTTITNGIEMVADAIRRNIIADGREFELIEHYPVTYPTAPTFSWVRFQTCQWHKDVEHADTIVRTHPNGTTVAYHYDPQRGQLPRPQMGIDPRHRPATRLPHPDMARRPIHSTHPRRRTRRAATP